MPLSFSSACGHRPGRGTERCHGADGRLQEVQCWQYFGGDLRASGLLIYERAKCGVVEGIFKLSLISSEIALRVEALHFWKSVLNGWFGRELCQGCSAWLFTHRGCGSQGTLLRWQRSHVVQRLLLPAFGLPLGLLLWPCLQCVQAGIFKTCFKMTL